MGWDSSSDVGRVEISAAIVTYHSIWCGQGHGKNTRIYATTVLVILSAYKRWGSKVASISGTVGTHP